MEPTTTPRQTTLRGLRALVTGGASGIGLATANELAARGADVAVLDLDPTGVAERFRSAACDITDDDGVDSAVRRLCGGQLDILINNAGIGAVGTVADNPLSEWRRVFDVNVLGIVRVTRAALPYLRRSQHAAVVNTCSVAAPLGLVDRALYSASKGAVESLTRAMAADHLREGIRVNCVEPGTVDTPWVGRLLAQSEDAAASREALLRRQPTGRLVTPDEVAFAIAYLADPRALSTTGTTVAVDGGMHSLLAQARR